MKKYYYLSNKTQNQLYFNNLINNFILCFLYENDRKEKRKKFKHTKKSKRKK